jgi:hypothetical protein
MIHSTTFLKRDHHLLYTNFTKSNTMEGKKEGSLPTQFGAKSLTDLKKELNVISNKDSLTFTGGKMVEKDKWNNLCGGFVPQ